LTRGVGGGIARGFLATRDDVGGGDACYFCFDGGAAVVIEGEDEVAVYALDADDCGDEADVFYGVV
jgi:hypothetical protein